MIGASSAPMGDAGAGREILGDHVLDDCSLSGAGLADDVELRPPTRTADHHGRRRCLVAHGAEATCNLCKKPLVISP